VQAVAERADAPFLVAVLDQQVREIAHALDCPRLHELFLGQRVGQPLGDMASRFQAAAGRALIGPAREPVGAEAAVGVLQAERIFVKVIDESLCPLPLAVEWLAALLALVNGVAESRHAVRTAAGRPDDRLSQLFLYKSLNVPHLPVVTFPLLIRLEVVGKGDELERELGFGAAGFLLVLDQVGDGEPLPLDEHRKVGLHA